MTREATIGARISEIYTGLDRTIAEHTGIARNGDEKTYKYLERAVKTVRDTAGSAESEYKQQIADLTAEKQRLEKIVNEGSHDSELSKQLSSVRAELDATKDQYNRVRADMDKAKAAHAKESCATCVSTTIWTPLWVRSSSKATSRRVFVRLSCSRLYRA